MPASPVRMSIHPATWRLKNGGLVVTAKARIAPIAISASPVAVLMVPLYPSRVIHSTPLLIRLFPGKAMAPQRHGRCAGPRSEPTPARIREGIGAERDQPDRDHRQQPRSHRRGGQGPERGVDPLRLAGTRMHRGKKQEDADGSEDRP